MKRPFAFSTTPSGIARDGMYQSITRNPYPRKILGRPSSFLLAQLVSQHQATSDAPPFL